MISKNWFTTYRIVICLCIIFSSEISEAQDKFTNLLQKVYLNQPSEREIVRLIMLCVGRGGQGDVGQKIRDEILVIQVYLLDKTTCVVLTYRNTYFVAFLHHQRNNNCKTGMMEEWHQKLHNNSSPDDVIICEVWKIMNLFITSAVINI